MIKAALNAVLRATGYGFNILDSSRNRRRLHVGRLKSDDKALAGMKRSQLMAICRDIDRNFAVAAWMVRRHLDFVADFNFNCREKDKGLRRDVEDYVRTRAKKDNFDRARRHDLGRWIRLFEARAVLDGDVFGVNLADGALQALQAERCKQPSPKAVRNSRYKQLDRWEYGVYTDNGLASLAYSFSAGKKDEPRIIPAGRITHHGYFREFDQTRGTSLIASGLETLVDTYEVVDYGVAKAKVSQLFALKITRTGDDAPAPIKKIEETDESENPQQEANQDKHEIDFGGGPVFLDLEEGEDADFMNAVADLPIELVAALIAITLKALDIPFSMWDPNAGNFHSARAQMLVYLRACKEKRAAIRTILSDWYEWQIQRAFAYGDLLRPSGIELPKYLWQPTGTPWWNPSQEVTAQTKAIDAGLNSRQRVVAETLGIDWFDLVEELQIEKEALETAGLATNATKPTAGPGNFSRRYAESLAT